MSHRLGICSSCNAQYKVPASFQADRAKCKSCGGVVAIGPVGGAAPEPAKPAAKAPAPAAAPAPKPAAPAVPAKPVPARPVAAKPAPKPVAEEKDSVRAAAQAAADRVREAGKGAAAAAPAKAGARSERASAKAGAGSKSRSSAGSRRGGKGGKDAKKSKGPLLAVVGLLVVAGGGAAWFLTQGDDGGPQAAEKTEQVAEAPEANEPEAPMDEPEAAAAETSAPEAAPEAPAEAEAETPAEKPAEAASALDDIDLSTFPDQEKLPGTSDEDWAQIQEWTATFFDASAGAAGTRARGKLLERSREAFPAVLNAMKRLDFSTEDGFRAGDLGQRFLMDVCGGRNFGWNYDKDENDARTPASVVFNKKVVRSWIKAWEQARELPKAWATLTKTEEADAIELFKKTGPFEGLEDASSGESSEAASASSALDDL